jgi:hypothetical protein
MGPPMAGRSSTPLRTAALLAAGALGVHELRYGLAFGAHAQGRLAAEGHAYLGWLSPAVVGLVVLAASALVHTLARGGRPHAARPRRFGLLWAACASALAFAYVTQEGLEGALAAGHPGGLAGIFGHGGWTAFLLAGAIGLIVALAVRGGRDALAAAERLSSAPRLPRPSSGGVVTPGVAPYPHLDVLAGGGAARAPPLVAR